MKIALVRPNYYTHLITPPLGLGYLAAYLKQAGFSAEIIDGLNRGLGAAEITRLCAGADLVGINCYSAYYPQVIQLGRALKQAGKVVVIGGPHPTFLPEETLRETGADYIVLGEGEETLKELACALDNRLPIEKIPGLFSSGSGSAKRDFITDLDCLPFPDWQQIDPRVYKKAPHSGVVRRFPVAPITSSRGCPYSCSFCASPQFWQRKIRFRSARNVVDEIEFLAKRFRVREIHFEDDNLTLKREHVANICEEILRRGIKVSWATPNGIRADTLDVELMNLMKRSGCYQLAFGIESADEGILKHAGKEAGLEAMERAIRIARKAGIMTQGFFIFGLPGETPQTIRSTIKYARDSLLDKAQFLLLDIFPGSRLWDELAGQFNPDWQRRSYQQVSWVPLGLTAEYLQQAPAKAFRSFFRRPQRLWKMAAMIRPGQLGFVLRRMRDFGVFGRAARFNTRY
jgi:radical SAM superfamily enzyme YgiQ (UPF0313 family)